MGRRTVLLGAAVAAAILVVAGVRLAAAGEDGNPTTLLDRVAAKLGIETDRLEQAFRDARSDQIDERVQSGDLTQEEADRLKQRLDAMPLEDGFGPGSQGGFGRGPGAGMEKIHGAFGLGLDLIDAKAALADFLGIDEADLVGRLANGESLASIAEAQDKTRDELKSFLQSEATTRIDDAVAAGRITEDRAAELKANLSDRLDALIDGSIQDFKGRFRFGGPLHPGNDGNEPTPAAPQSESSLRS